MYANKEMMAMVMMMEVVVVVLIVIKMIVPSVVVVMKTDEKTEKETTTKQQSLLSATLSHLLSSHSLVSNRACLSVGDSRMRNKFRIYETRITIKKY